MKNKNLGSICFDKTLNRWLVFYYITDNMSNHKKRAKKSFKNELDAQKFLEQYNSNNQDNNSCKNYSLNDILVQVLENKLKFNNLSDKQYSILSGINKIISAEDFSSKNIKDVTEEDLFNYFNRLINYSDSYIKKIYNHLNYAFKYASITGFIDNNFMINIFKPKTTKNIRKIRSLNDEEQLYLNKFLMMSDIIEFPYKNVYLLILHMGLRVGEALGLKLNDINLINNTIAINKIVVNDKNNQPILIENYENSRTVNINKEILISLKKQLNIAKTNPENYLFLSRNYTLVMPGTINKILQKIMNNIGSKNIQTQSLRYTFRDECLKNGLTQKEIIKLTGPINFE